MAGGPPRVTWHITWDSLRADGSPAISHSAVSDYLNNQGYQVHLVWDPVTGDIIQLLPADRGGAGLVHHGAPETNNMGEVNLQIEAYFTPGVVRVGVRYDQLTDTPMVNLDRIMAWADSWGIPRTAPLSPGDRNASTWSHVGGHYGHFNAPGNDHGDPIVAIADILAHGSTPSPPPAPPRPAYKEIDMVLLQAKPSNDIYLVGASPKPVHLTNMHWVDQLRGQGVPLVDDASGLIEALMK